MTEKDGETDRDRVTEKDGETDRDRQTERFTLRCSRMNDSALRWLAAV